MRIENKLKKLLSFILVVVMLFGVIPPTSLAVEQQADRELEFVAENEEIGLQLLPLSTGNPVRLPLDIVEQDLADLQALMTQAAQQAINGDRTPLSEPVEWRFLFLCYTHIRVAGDSQDFHITNAQRQWLQDIADEFQELVESAVSCIRIHVSIVFIEDLLTIPQTSENMIGTAFAISQSLIQADLDRIGVLGNYDIVLTTVPEDDPFFIGGFAAADITSGFGYGAFSLGHPHPLGVNEIRWGTRVDIHEWLHMLEGAYKWNDFLPGVLFPNVHGYLNYPEYANYGTWSYCPDTGNWPYYKAILQGQLLYGGLQEIGMFPQMWRLTPREINRGGNTHSVKGISEWFSFL